MKNDNHCSSSIVIRDIWRYSILNQSFNFWKVSLECSLDNIMIMSTSTGNYHALEIMWCLNRKAQSLPCTLIFQLSFLVLQEELLSLEDILQLRHACQTDDKAVTVLTMFIQCHLLCPSQRLCLGLLFSLSWHSFLPLSDFRVSLDYTHTSKTI